LKSINVKKTSHFKTQCKGDISHASKTAKVTVCDPVICKFRSKWGNGDDLYFQVTGDMCQP